MICSSPLVLHFAAVAVSTNTDRDSTLAAITEVSDLRHGARNLAGSYCYEGKRLATGWHFHDLHQVEYALSGLVEVEDPSGHYLLPPQQAAWIPAGVVHESTLHTTVRTISVFFEPELIDDPGGRVRILAVDPLIRELIIGSLRWPIDRTESEPITQSYFATLAHLVGETLEDEAPLRLPTCSDPLVTAAMAYTQENLQSVGIDDVARRSEPLPAPFAADSRPTPVFRGGPTCRRLGCSRPWRCSRNPRGRSSRSPSTSASTASTPSAGRSSPVSAKPHPRIVDGSRRSRLLVDRISPIDRIGLPGDPW